MYKLEERCDNNETRTSAAGCSVTPEARDASVRLGYR